MPRIAAGGFRHETNTFAPTPATWDDFEKGYSWPPLSQGEELFPAMRGYNLALSGFIDAAERAECELVPLLWASASPSGAVLEDVYERIVAMLLDGIEAALPLDAVYLSLHGAMVAEHVDDGEGELLRRLRDRIGPSVPVVVSLDYHANVSAEMVRHATALVGYRSYPHVDMAETGVRAFALLSDILASGQRPAAAWRQLPFLIPLPWGCTTTEPAALVLRRLEALERDGVASLTFAAGFPAADTPDCGPSVFGYGTDRTAVGVAVETLASEVAAREAEWAGAMLGPEEAVREAIIRARDAVRPVVLADVQDNPGAGGTADTMGLLKALVRHRAEGAAIGLVFAPHVATIAHRRGEGAEIHVSLGGKHGVEGDSPLDATFRVEKLCDGQVHCTGPFYGGARMDLAPMACLSLGGVRVVVVGKKVQAADQAMFRAVGIEPAETKILALKSSVHFRADLEPIADSILMVEAPGPMVVDPGRLPFRKLRPGVRRRSGRAEIDRSEMIGRGSSSNV